MALSGTVTYRTNKSQVINGALREISAYDPESTGPTATQVSNAGEALNLLVKAYAVRGLQLWSRKWAVIFPQYHQSVYALGTPGAGGDHACLSTPLGVGGFVSTTLSTSASGGATTISVASLSSSSTAGVSAVTIANGYNIGIRLDSGTIFWTTVSGSPSGLVVTLASALSGSASGGNLVYCYQNKLSRPLRIIDAFIRQPAGNDLPLTVISREQYNRFGQKNLSYGTPTQLVYDRQMNTGYIYTFPVFSDTSQLLYVELEKQLDDLVDSGDDYEMPQEWGAFLKFKLAQHLAPEYEVPQVKFNQISAIAEQLFTLVDGADQEAASVFFTPNMMVMNPHGGR